MLVNFMDHCGVEDWFQVCLYIYSTNVVRLVSACSPLPLCVCQVWPQPLCQILTSSVLLRQGQTLTQPAWQQQLRSVSRVSFLDH